jgi:charged multivesicular body protein 5
MDSRIEAVDQKIRKLDADLIRYREQLAKLPEGPSKESVKRQAMQILQQKKQYEQQKGVMMNQSFNLEQTNFTIESMKSTAQTVQVMKDSSKELKKTIGKMDVGKVEDLRDDIEDLMMESNEINEVLARSYGTPEYLDEADLEAELGMLQEFQGVEENPSYLESLPAAPSTAKDSASHAPMAEGPSNA